jgi:N-acyl-phosphatidylethanolamine-hydrolysing phospholipase D
LGNVYNKSLFMTADLDRIQDAFLEPHRWWNLQIDQDRIVVASLWRRVCQWIEACFTCQHRDRLVDRVQAVCLTAKPYEQLSEPQKIVADKVSSLIRNCTGWFAGVSNNYTCLPEVKPIVSCAGTPIASSLQPHQEGERYYNHAGEKIWHQFLETLRLLFPGSLGAPSDQDLMTWYRTQWTPCSRSQEPQVVWLGHSALLLQVAGFNILMDPSFNFVGPCFKRHTAPGIAFEALPQIDIVVTSHNHGDHFDQDHLRKLSAYQPIAFVPDKLDDWFEKNGYQNVVGNPWWKQTTFTRDGKTVKITAVPAQHGSQTTLSDINKTLWMGAVIEVGGFKAYFAGDTGYNPEIFREVREKFGTIDVAFLPIAPEGEAAMHTDHKEALKAFRDLGAKQMVPIHWGAYRTGPEKVEDPINKLQAALETPDFVALKDRVVCPKLGEALSLKSQAAEQSAVA